MYFTNQGDEFGQKVVIAQRTVRLANVRNGLRKITLRNERDNKTFPMAQVLVNIKVFTTAEIEQEDAKLNHAIEVRLLKKKLTNFADCNLRGKGYWLGSRLSTKDKKGEDACY